MELSKTAFNGLVKVYKRFDKLSYNIYKALGITGDAGALDECINELYMHILELCGYDDNFYKNVSYDYTTHLENYLLYNKEYDLDDLYNKIVEETSSI